MRVSTKRCRMFDCSLLRIEFLKATTMLLWVSPKPNSNLKARVSRLAWNRRATSKRPTRRSRSARSSLFPCRENSMDDLKGFVHFFFRYLPETREEIDVEANPAFLSSQRNLVPADGTSQEEVQKTAIACCHERRRCRF